MKYGLQHSKEALEQKEEFERNMWVKLAFFIIAACFGYFTYLLYEMGSNKMFLELPIAVFALFMFVWQMNNPFIELGQNDILIKENIMRIRNVHFSNVTTIEYTGGKHLILHRKGESPLKIPMFYLASSEKERLATALQKTLEAYKSKVATAREELTERAQQISGN